jgi:hypothetical protein
MCITQGMKQIVCVCRYFSELHGGESVSECAVPQWGHLHRLGRPLQLHVSCRLLWSVSLVFELPAVTVGILHNCMEYFSVSLVFYLCETV